MLFMSILVCLITAEEEIEKIKDVFHCAILIYTNPNSQFLA